MPYSVITRLLDHNPDERPSALELSQSNLLPPRVEDEFFKDTLQMIGKILYVYSSAVF